jgi:hypothetical protein
VNDSADESEYVDGLLGAKYEEEDDMEESETGEREYSCDGRGVGVVIPPEGALPLPFVVSRPEESDEGEK